MFDALAICFAIVLYIGFLFAIALWGERRVSRRKKATNGTIYSLSVMVYCTSWTVFGSVGKAATGGLSFLTVYIGPTLMMVFWWTILRKLVRAKNKYRITSIADFISARYDKSEGLAALGTLIALIGVVPYIALQLKAVISSFSLISSDTSSFWMRDHIGALVVFLMIIFTILFGVRRLDPTERHQGMVLALAIECLVKLAAVLAVGLFVTYSMYDGFGDISRRALEVTSTQRAITTPPAVTWTTCVILGMAAILFLPRQFHVCVVENSDERHIRKAQWMGPLYMLLVTIFVFPIAIGGLLSGLPGERGDTFVLQLPLDAGVHWLALFVFVGGFSASIGMIMASSMTTSTMVTNHLLLPIVERVRPLHNVRRYLLQCRWAAVALFVLLGYWFTLNVGNSYMLVNMGLISFTAVTQFAPAIIGGLFWRKGNKVGAMAGLSSGFLMWAYTLMIPALAKSGWIPAGFVQDGIFGIQSLRPHQLFGLTGVDQFSNALLWSMIFNIGSYIIGSLATRPSRQEQENADGFINLLAAGAMVTAKPAGGAPTVVVEKKMETLGRLFCSYLSRDDAQRAMDRCLVNAGVKNKEKISIVELGELSRESERILAGSIGAASAHHAVRKIELFEKGETESLSSAYGDILARMMLTPEDLHKKIDFYQERSALMKAHAEELEQTIEELRIQMVERQRAEEELAKHRDRLEAMVGERTTELTEANQKLKEEIVEREKIQSEREKLHRELLETSHRAGMAEVATGVLHNVGNVLNSLNVSARIVRNVIEKSSVLKLPMIAELLEKNAEDMDAFVATEKGKLLPKYIGELAARVTEENAKLGEEITSLSENIEHIKQIIAMQQSYARVAGISEPVAVWELVEDALQINSAALVRHGIDVIRADNQVGEIVVNKHKVLQILVNLISNAKYALSKSTIEPRQITIHTEKRKDNVCIVVKDNGVGISKEHLNQIFNHGFTTKKDGHGFGLHNSANAAKEVGGILSAKSEGQGKGSTFTLELPPAPQDKSLLQSILGGPPVQASGQPQT